MEIFENQVAFYYSIKKNLQNQTTLEIQYSIL